MPGSAKNSTPVERLRIKWCRLGPSADDDRSSISDMLLETFETEETEVISPRMLLLRRLLSLKPSPDAVRMPGILRSPSFVPYVPGFSVSKAASRVAGGSSSVRVLCEKTAPPSVQSCSPALTLTTPSFGRSLSVLSTSFAPPPGPSPRSCGISTPSHHSCRFNLWNFLSFVARQEIRSTVVSVLPSPNQNGVPGYHTLRDQDSSTRGYTTISSKIEKSWKLRGRHGAWGMPSQGQWWLLNRSGEPIQSPPGSQTPSQLL
eukprot:2239315-Rhodomonas_salina.1